MPLDRRRKAHPLPRRIQKVPGQPGLYVDAKSGTYLRRVQSDGRNTYQSLGTAKKPQALKTLEDLRLGEVAARHGLVAPTVSQSPTVQVVLDRYRDDGFPDHQGLPRAEGPHLIAERSALVHLAKFFRDQPAEDLRQDSLDAYLAYRQKAVRNGDGRRSTDLELNTLNNALKWAVRKQLLPTNPVATRVRYYSPTLARHCKDVAPVSAEELHTIAGHLFADRRSESLGWQALVEAFTGLRTNEALALRQSAQPNEPGWQTEDGGSLCVRRSKKGQRENPFVEVHPALRALLTAHADWHRRRFPDSPWFLPGRDPRAPLNPGALTHALDRLYETKVISRKITSHGLRAYYVLVRRSNGISDTRIAWEINHVGGVGTLEKSYGGVPQHWRDGKAPQLDWLPKGEPAWARLAATTSGAKVA